MAQQVSLFDTMNDSQPVVARVSRSHQALALAALQRDPGEYDLEFVSWLRVNWPLWNRFCRLADEVRMRRSNYSARAIFHAIRLETILREAPVVNGHTPVFKVNNRWSAAMARLYNDLTPSRKGFFRTREPGQ